MDSFVNRQFSRTDFTGEKVKNIHFLNCDFSSADLTDTEFVDCFFYNKDSQVGCDFNRAILKGASFKNCDLSMSNFKNTSALGLEISGCSAQGVDFRGARFVNMITSRSWFCSAYITKTNLSYANLSGVMLERCELWENRWNGTVVSGAVFKGSDLSGGEFLSLDWTSADFSYCNLVNSSLSGLDARRMDLQGVILDNDQVNMLVESLGIIVSP
ncbi:Qnr family pentapeptide repeat protein [Providencia hangzhouensis]|uniref:Qnr family pentapeptide repeat protein n=2 Tax=Providencia hangzhouensis TaxID=3031799 RepID=UPI0034DDB27B